uniref:Uncharacterized protein n=1 Tax=Arundo donax TaxID=35708 RepID=A0A0A8YXE5_ARUDO
MTGDDYYMGLLNETDGNNGMDCDSLGSPPEEQQETLVDTTPTTTGN